MQELYNSQREYFLTFLARTNQKQRTIEHLLDYLPEYSPQTATAIEQRKKTRFSDIGPGIGKVSIPFVASLGDKIDYTAREPSLGMAINFFFNYLVEELPCQKLTINPRESSDYGKEEFDFILASHSFYYLPDWSNSLKSVYDSLVPGGAACIIIGSEESGLFQLRKEFFPILHGVSPRSGEELTAVLEKTRIPYKTDTIDSRIDLIPELEDDTKHIREESIVEPSLESLFSFLLRTDYTKLSADMQERVKKFVYERANKNRYLGLKDKAIWLTKPGVHTKRQDAGENTPRKITLDDFLQTFKPMLESHFGKDIEFLSPGLKQAYYSILALDCVLSHPISKLTIMVYKSNSDTDYDDYFHPFKPKDNMRIKDFVLFDPGEERRLKDLPVYHTDEYIFLYTHTGDMEPYFFDLAGIEYEFLPVEDREQINKRDFIGLMLHLFKRFKHSKVFSSRNDGSTIMSLFVESEFTGLKVPENLPPKLTEIYKQMSIKPPEPSPITV